MPFADTAGSVAREAEAHDEARAEAAALPDRAPQVVIESVRPIPAGGSHRFAAIVRNMRSTAVRWSIDEVDAGQKDAGTIDAISGMYVAPARGGAVLHVSAVSDEDPRTRATIEITVARAAVKLDSPELSVAAGATSAMHAAIVGSVATELAWSIEEGASGGTIDPVSGLYTAPTTPGLYHAVATSVTDPAARGVVAVSVPFTPIAVTPILGTVAAGGTRKFGASIAGPSQAVTWRVAEANGGTISSSGVYTAPAGARGVFHVVATGVSDPTMSAKVPIIVGDVMPSLVSQGGPVVRHPTLVAVTFPGDALATSLGAFMTKYGASSEWSAQTAEYDVGAASAAPTVVLTEAAPKALDDDALQTWLAGKLDGTHPEFGTPSPDTIYTIYVPRSMVVTASFGSTCAPLGGYHSFVTLPSGMHVPYAVIARCRGDNLDWVTQLTSHELVEAVTDPEVNWNEAYAFADDAHAIWGLLHPEVGDMCEWDAISSGTNVKPPSLGFQIQRSWSNAAMAHGHEPCVPALPGEIYFTALPAMTESVTLTSGGQSTSTSGVHVAVGHSRTIDLALTSDGPRRPWGVYAWDMGKGTLKMHLDRATGESGDTLHLTITVLAADHDFGGEPFEVVSFDGEESHSFYGFVGN